MSSSPRLAKNSRGSFAAGAGGSASSPNGNVITARAPSSRMRPAMYSESLVHTAASRSDDKVESAFLSWGTACPPRP